MDWKTLLKYIYLPWMCAVQIWVPLAACVLSGIYQQLFWDGYSRVLGNWQQKVIMDIKASDGVCEPLYEAEFSFVFPGNLIR